MIAVLYEPFLQPYRVLPGQRPIEQPIKSFLHLHCLAHIFVNGQAVLLIPQVDCRPEQLLHFHRPGKARAVLDQPLQNPSVDAPDIAENDRQTFSCAP